MLLIDLDQGNTAIDHNQSNRNTLLKSNNAVFGRNQFILGPRIPERYSSWPHCKVASELWLATHPLLGVHHATGSGCSITSIGFFLSPAQPQADDQTLINELILSLTTGFESFERNGLANLSGRWFIIAQRGDESRLYTDALGSRQVVHGIHEDVGELWCASQAHLIADIFKETPDSSAQAFLSSYRKENPEYWIPGDATLFASTRQLLPNHFLCLNDGKVKRYWPHDRIHRIDPNEAVRLAAEILRGTMKAAARRFDLTLLLTAGIDSRILLAASREICEDIECMTVRKEGMSLSHPELAIPAALTKKLGLPHHVVTAPQSPSEAFKTNILEHMPLAHPIWMPDLDACQKYFDQHRVAIQSSGSEITRCWYRLPNLATQVMTPSRLAYVTNMENEPFVIEQFRSWLHEASATNKGLHLSDLLFWEQRIGRWLSSSLLESDIAWGEVVSPFNNRGLLVTLLSAPAKDRQGPDYRLSHALIKHLWPEAYAEPFNPHKPPWPRGWRYELSSALRVYRADLKNLLHRVK